MNLKINHIITLENNKEYILLNKTMYYGKNYFLAMTLDDNKEATNEVVMLEEKKEEEGVFVKIVEETGLKKILTGFFRAQL